MQSLIRQLQTEESLKAAHVDISEHLWASFIRIRQLLDKVIFEKDLLWSLSRTEKEIEKIKRRVGILNAKMEYEKSQLDMRQSQFEDMQRLFDLHSRKVVFKNADFPSFDVYMKEFSKYDRKLNALHPFRRLRSISQSLLAQQRETSLKLFSMFSDFLDQDMQILAPLVVLLGSVYNVPLPFPIVFGSYSSSPSLKLPMSPSVPMILHVFKGTASTDIDCLLIEDLRFIAAIAQSIPVPMIPEVSDYISLLSLTMNSAPVSLSSSITYRKAPVIEQSVTEGGEWTLLDQL